MTGGPLSLFFLVCLILARPPLSGSLTTPFFAIHNTKRRLFFFVCSKTLSTHGFQGHDSTRSSPKRPASYTSRDVYCPPVIGGAERGKVACEEQRAENGPAAVPDRRSPADRTLSSTHTHNHPQFVGISLVDMYFFSSVVVDLILVALAVRSARHTHPVSFTLRPYTIPSSLSFVPTHTSISQHARRGTGDRPCPASLFYFYATQSLPVRNFLEPGQLASTCWACARRGLVGGSRQSLGQPEGRGTPPPSPC